MKRACRYRFCPSAQQETERRRTFGRVRKVFDLALEARTRAWYTEQRRVFHGQASATLTEGKMDPELAYLGEASSAPVQLGLRHL
jgi:putative transposase